MDFRKLLRLPLNWIPLSTVLPILQGPAQRKKWIVGSGTHRYWLGRYEADKAKHFLKEIHPGDTVFDIGAHVGYYTLLASMAVGPNGTVVAFEPVKENLDYLKKHIDLNKIPNVRIIETAISDRNGIAKFSPGQSRAQGSLYAEGSSEIAVHSLDQLLLEKKVPIPSLIKIDVECAEYAVLQGAKKLLCEKHPILFVALDHSLTRSDCVDFLESIGYKLESLTGQPLKASAEVVAYPAAIKF